MQEQNYKEIVLSEIKSNPQSPRKSFSGPAFDELVASIREKGVIEPIIVRTWGVLNKLKYEVIAGERRFTAACLIADKKLKEHTIPAVIRDLSDDEAFDFMIIENLQREDLTPFEEAQSFKEYFTKKGKGSIPELAKRISKSAGYIRRKIAALSLPGYALTSWEKGNLTFSHLEQLRRLKDKEELKEAFDFAIGARFGRGDDGRTKRELKEHIDQSQPLLEKAFFNLEKAGCMDCGQNSDVQQNLWEVGSMKGAHCLNRACFKQKQNNYLTKHWKETTFCKRFKTNGFRFSENIQYNDYNDFSSYRNYGITPAAKCKKCENFLTIIYFDGRVDKAKACFGEESCFRDIARAREKKTAEKEKKEREEKGILEGPRVAWHGEHFREEFLSKRLPEVFQKCGHDSLKMARMGLFAFVKLDRTLLDYMAKEAKLKDSYWRDKNLFEHIAKLGQDQIQVLMKLCAGKIIMRHYPVTCDGRLAAATHLGIDLKKEFAVTKDYLEHKTIREMLEFGESSKLFKDKKVKDYLVNKLKKKPEKFSSCKKTELIDLFLKSGADLVGKVPKEILEK